MRGGVARISQDTALSGLKVRGSRQPNQDCRERAECARGIWAQYSLLSHTCAGIDPNPKSSLPQGETESQETTGALLKGSYQFFNAGL